MNNFAEIVRVGIITGLGVVLMIIALLMFIFWNNNYGGCF